MAVYAVNDEGVRALKEAQMNIISALENIRQATQKVKGDISGYDNAGPHHDEIIEIIEGIETTIQNATTPCEEVALNLGKLADDYQAIIDKKLGRG